MRQKRSKAYKKQIAIYNHTFKFREPYQILVDGELVLNCEKASFNVVDGLNRTVHGETKPMITQCCMQHLYKTENQRAIDIAKRFERRRCNHPPSNPLPPADCVKSITDVNGENKFRYIIATQDHDLRKALRKIPGVPLIHMNRSVMVMEPISDATTGYIKKVEREKLTRGLNDARVAGIKRPSDDKETDNSNEEKKPTKKHKGPKAPNPLSMKKKKKTDSEEKKEAPKKRRKRHHKSQDNKGDESNGKKNEDSENDS